MRSSPAKALKPLESPEEQALSALQTNDYSAALTILMETYGDEIYRHCRQVLADTDLASDVHQTVFVQAYRDLVTFSRRSTFRTWLFAIARHRCLDAIKLRKRRGLRFLLGFGQREIVDVTTNTEDMIHKKNATLELQEALDSLKPKVRIAVLLRYREEMSYEEMAQVCGERPATLQARVIRAMPKLRTYLEQAGLTR